MLQYRTRAGVLPNPCNCGFLENQGLQRISLYVKSWFWLETHVTDSQRCRPAFAEAASRRQVQGFYSTPARLRYCFFATGGVNIFLLTFLDHAIDLLALSFIFETEVVRSALCSA